MKSEADKIGKQLKDMENEKRAMSYRTNLAKDMFIDEIKNGLGDHIKGNCKKIEVVKPTFWQRFGNIIKKIFTGF